MSVDFSVGDLVWMPPDPKTKGRIVDIRDYGIEIWVRPLDPTVQTYYSYYDQLKSLNVLDLIVENL